jgi:hypothetical protein
VQFVLSQIIPTDVISVAAISTAAGSDSPLMTSSIHSFSTEVDSKSGDARARRTDYFGRIATRMKHDGTGATVQLKMGNDNIPYAPIGTPQELSRDPCMSSETRNTRRCDDGATATVVDSIMDIMYKRNDSSHPLLHCPMPGCITYQSKRLPGSSDTARTLTSAAIVPWQAWMGPCAQRCCLHRSC